MNDKHIKAEDLLKCVRIGNHSVSRIDSFSSLKTEMLIGTIPNFCIVKDAWYRNFFTKLKDKFITYIYKRKGFCTCECHRKKGFFHCWDNGCCGEENKKLI